MDRSHPSADLLARYASGELPAAPALTVGAHAEACPECDAKIREVEQAAGALLSSLPPADLAPDALDRILKRIAEDPWKAEAPPSVSWLGDAKLPAAVARFGLASRRWLKPGVWIAHVRAPRTGGWRAYLVRAAANTILPTHAHPATELISILYGAFYDGRNYVAGDFTRNEAGTEHRQQVTSDGPCISLVATQAPARWRGVAKFIAPLYKV